MTYFQEEDIAGLLDEPGIGVDVTAGEATTKGILDTADEELLRGEGTHLIGKGIVVTLKTDSLPGLKIGDPITVDGRAYVVRDKLQTGDGALTRVLCTS